MSENLIALQTKLEMRKSKDQLIGNAKYFKLSTEGTKLELAKRIAEYLSNNAERNWKAIQGVL